ncbi:MAG: hypothetical protein ACTTKZ_03305 [Bacteroides sp.]
MEKALLIETWSDKMTLTFGDSVHDESISELSERFPEEVSVITPNIDMDSAIEKLVEQALWENKGEDVTEDEYRLNLVKLINSVKKRQAVETQRLAKTCFDLALTKVRNDSMWIGQFITLYPPTRQCTAQQRYHIHRHARLAKCLSSLSGRSRFLPQVCGLFYADGSSLYVWLLSRETIPATGSNSLIPSGILVK